MSEDNVEDRPFVLVVAIDLNDTDSGGFALDQAARIAVRIPGSEMHVLHVAAVNKDEEAARIGGMLRLYIAEKAAALGGLARQSVGIHVRQGEPAKEIAQLAHEVMADAIVVGAHKGPTLRTLVLGTTAEKVMAVSSCPVVIAGPRPRPQPSHVITIDPPCPDCVETRRSTAGRSWWCPRHSENHHLRRHHVYSYQTELPFEQHDSEVTATGGD
jgi:nucleotide-binding universal stress UspA family protein